MKIDEMKNIMQGCYDEGYKDAVNCALVERLKLAGDDLAAALEATIEDNEKQDAEAIEHCRAMINRWRDLTDNLKLDAE